MPPFLAQYVEPVEFRDARDLQEPLGYARWENFMTPIKRAMENCESVVYKIPDHFRERPCEGARRLCKRQLRHREGACRFYESAMRHRVVAMRLCESGVRLRKGADEKLPDLNAKWGFASARAAIGAGI